MMEVVEAKLITRRQSPPKQLYPQDREHEKKEKEEERQGSKLRQRLLYYSQDML